MNFSKTTEYALRILSFMAKDEEKLYNANEIFDSLKIPFRYLRKQMTVLSKHGFLVSIQGKSGGYRIAKKLTEISLLDIVKATDEEQFSNKCFFGFTDCAVVTKCTMHDKWELVRGKIYDVLSSTSLNDLK